MIDQTTVGHKYLKEQFGATPSVGWQIGACHAGDWDVTHVSSVLCVIVSDPFGHSATQV